MRFFICAVLIMTAILPAKSAETPEKRTYEVAAGKTFKVGHYSTSQADCSFGDIPWITITKKPTDGTLNTEVSEYTKKKSISKTRSYCIGKEAKGVALYYTPNANFHGTDTIEFRVNYNTTMIHYYSAQLIVK